MSMDEGRGRPGGGGRHPINGSEHINNEYSLLGKP